MSYKTYDSYKHSNNNWMNNIPSHWEINRFKIVFSYSKGKNPKTFFDDNDDGLAPYLSMEYLRNDINPTYVPVKECPLKAESGDILLLWDGSNAGEFVVSKKGLVSSTMAKLTPNITIDKNLSKYLCKSIEPLLRELTIGMGVPHVSTTELNNILIPNIPFEEQKQIANYLDKKTVKIDATIAKNKELIDLLEEKRVALINQVVTKGLNPDVPMKDSGVEWIGEIPEHWEVEKLKNISQIRPSNVDKKSKDNEPPVLLCNYTDVYNNEFITMNLDFMKATATHDQIRKLSLNVGDIIITKDSESADDIAVPAIVTEELENVVCGYHLAIIKPNTNIVNPKFLFRSFESDRINKQFELGANGVTRFGLGTYPISNAYVCQPPLNEQKEIANYLDVETAKIFKATDKINEHIGLLEEYKTSLIHHVVTGKIDVRGEEI